MPIGGSLCCAGKVGHYVDPFRYFEGAEFRAAVVSQFTLSRFHPRTQNDGRLDVLSVDCVGLAKRCRFEHFRVRQEDRVDVARRDFFSAAVNDFLEPSSYKEVAIRVSAAEVAAAEPSFNKAGGVCLRIVEISSRNRCAANPDFSDAPGCSILSIFGDNSDLDSRGQAH